MDRYKTDVEPETGQVKKENMIKSSPNLHCLRVLFWGIQYMIGYLQTSQSPDQQDTEPSECLSLLAGGFKFTWIMGVINLMIQTSGQTGKQE